MLLVLRSGARGSDRLALAVGCGCGRDPLEGGPQGTDADRGTRRNVVLPSLGTVPAGRKVA